jgi:predicted PurR-regulated permease PerM
MNSREYRAEQDQKREAVLSFLSRLGVWSIFFVVLYLLRNFFLLLFLTFVFCWIQSYGESLLATKIKRRGLRVSIIGMLFLAILVAIGGLTLPRAKDQAKLFAEKFPVYLRDIDIHVSQLRTEYPLLENLFPAPADLKATSPEDENWNPKSSPTALVIQELLGIDDSSSNLYHAKQTFELAQHLGAKLLGTISSFFMALLFSFLIVLDLERLTKSIKNLQSTRIRFVYDEVADGIYDFSQVLGRALGAQVVIAAVNTLLTAILLTYFGLGEKLAFLSILVFLCSFIPVAGVFISSVPISLMVFQQSGVKAVLLAALAIWLIHMIEAYILNPRIFGKHLRINPVLVLIILTVSGKLFGVWGLILGVPICSYIFGHAIRYKPPHSEQIPVNS